uniref:Uncharacterized protein n=1 Tax=Arundo donax TaxID=35708 RepID=A0A0A9FLX1_ARUDO
MSWPTLYSYYHQQQKYIISCSLNTLACRLTLSYDTSHIQLSFLTEKWTEPVSAEQFITGYLREEH